MKEKDLLTELVSIARRASSLALALDEMRRLIAREFGAAILVVRPPSFGPAISAGVVCEFLESRQFPFRGLYMAPLNAGGREAATLLACIGTFAGSGDLLRRITTFAGEQLAALVRRLPAQSLVYTEAV